MSEMRLFFFHLANTLDADSMGNRLEFLGDW